MSSDAIELARLKMENAKLTNQLQISKEEKEIDADMIRSLNREVNKLKLMIEDDQSKELALLRLERENKQLKNDLIETNAKARSEKYKRGKIESSLSEVEDDILWLREKESKQRKEKQKLKCELDETKYNLRRVTKSQENLQSLLSEDKREYSRAEKEFKKLEDSILSKRQKRRRRLYGNLLSSDSDSDSYPSYNYRLSAPKHYRHYLY
ncbi:hypothetical protein LOD99_13923 [Oopsacas minuta]|uniref:Uncharacterized protein n=1 Tax=Oopsacas minuta TaxID=111878 RepID=A0AAV7KHH0_9METZ|nr:hypothetical protein LOD99_13923 [Oopsacas minuta]